LLADLDAIRARGYATAVEEAEPGVAAVAVAVRARSTGRAVGTTSIAGPMQRVTPGRFEEFHHLLRRAADKLGMIWPRIEGTTEERTPWTASASTA
jgi:DNA-binding IclR family transcriptional regulator